MVGAGWRVPLGVVLGVNAALGRNAVFAAVTVVSIAASVALSTSLEMSSRAVQSLSDRTAEALAGGAELEIVAGELGIPEHARRRAARRPASPPRRRSSRQTSRSTARSSRFTSLGIDLLEEGADRALELDGPGGVESRTS